MPTRILAVACAVLAVLVALSVPGGDTVVTVRSGDTISYICIKHYGTFSPEIAATVLQANPRISDINVIDAGWEIILPDLDDEPAPVDTMTRYARLTGSARQGVVTYLSGEADWRKAGATWSALEVNEILVTGDEMRTSESGRAEVVLDSRSVLRVGPASILKLTPSDETPEGGRLDLSVGRLWSNVAKIVSGTPATFQVGMPLAIAGVQGTVYRIDVLPDSSGLVRVYDGVVEVSSRPRETSAPRPIGPPHEVPGPHEVTMEEWTRIVRALQEIRIGPDGRPTDPTPFTIEADVDDWVRFNRERDADLGW
jgi:phage tail protein X